MRKLIIAAAFTTVFLRACKKDPSPSGTSATGKLEVRMTDNPAEYQEVNIDLQKVEVHTSGDTSSTSGWTAVNITPGIYNLLELTNGLDTVLGSVTLPVGKVSQIRFKLGNNNTVKVNDQVYALSTPSADQSGLKLQVHADIKENITYSMLIDFDAARSVVKTGNGTYKLKPVLRVITEATTGGFKGTVLPAASHAVIYAIKGTDSVSTFANDSTGMFMIKGLAPGDYTIHIKPGSSHRDTSFTSNTVAGSIKELGVINLQ
jgi:hypothetical protein